MRRAQIAVLGRLVDDTKRFSHGIRRAPPVLLPLELAGHVDALLAECDAVAGLARRELLHLESARDIEPEPRG